MNTYVGFMVYSNDGEHLGLSSAVFFDNTTLHLTQFTLFVFILALRLLKLYNLEFVLGTKGIIYVIVPHTKLVKDILDIEFSI